MKIFFDTVDTDVIEKYFSTGLVDGVKTNPTLIMGVVLKSRGCLSKDQRHLCSKT